MVGLPWLWSREDFLVISYGGKMQYSSFEFFGLRGLPVSHVTSDQLRASFPRCEFGIFINYIKELSTPSFFTPLCS